LKIGDEKGDEKDVGNYEERRLVRENTRIEGRTTVLESLSQDSTSGGFL